METGLPAKGVIVRLPRFTRFPLHTVSGGRLLMAYADQHLAETMELPRLTEKTITDRTALLADLEKIRQRGYVVICGEAHPQMDEIGVPIRDYRGAEIGMLGLCLPANRRDELEGFVPAVLAAAAQISRNMGYIEADLLARRNGN